MILKIEKMSEYERSYLQGQIIILLYSNKKQRFMSDQNEAAYKKFVKQFCEDNRIDHNTHVRNTIRVIVAAMDSDALNELVESLL